MEIAFYIIGIYLVFAIISRIFAERTKKSLLHLKARTVALHVNDEEIPKTEWATFNKNDHKGKILKYTIAYTHPLNLDGETTYDAYEVAMQESKFIQKPEIPLDKPFDITVHPTKPQKVNIGHELSMKDMIDKKMEELEQKKNN